MQLLLEQEELRAERDPHTRQATMKALAPANPAYHDRIFI